MFRCDFVEDRQHLQRSSNKLSPPPRLHTRIWEWMISVVGKEWAVRFHSHRTRHGRSGEPWSEKCRAADWLGQTPRHPCGHPVCLKLRSRAPRRTGNNVGEGPECPVSAAWSGAFAAPEEYFQQIPGGWAVLYLAESKRSTNVRSESVSQCIRGGRLVARLVCECEAFS